MIIGSITAFDSWILSESSGSCFIGEDVRSTNSYLRGLDVHGLMDSSFTAYDSDQSNNVNK